MLNGLEVRSAAKCLLETDEGYVVVYGLSSLINLPGGGIEGCEEPRTALFCESYEELDALPEQVTAPEELFGVVGETVSHEVIHRLA